MPVTVTRTVFKDIAKLAFDYVPPTLPHRETHLKQMMMIYRPLLDAKIPQHVSIYGPTGVGKTVLSKRFCAELQAQARQRGIGLEYVYVNCRERNSPLQIMLKIVTEFDPHFPMRGLSLTEILGVLQKILERQKLHVLIVLDEVYGVLKKYSADMIYKFVRMNENYSGSAATISLVLVSQQQCLGLLDATTLSSFKRTNTFRLDKYTKDELFNILAQRVELAFFPGCVEEEAIEHIAELAAEWGDARYALELLEKAGLLADENYDEKLKVEHVRAARAETYGVYSEDKIKGLDVQHQAVLLAVARALTRDAYAITGEVEKYYAVVCEEFGLEQRAHTQFWKYLKDLDAEGLITTKHSSVGEKGQTLLISLPEIPVKQLQTRLEQMLLH